MTPEIVASEALDTATRAALWRLWASAFDDFEDTDGAHAFGGLHALVREGAEVVAHASVVPRRLLIGREAWAVGYVEAVAVAPARQHQRLGSAVMTALQDLLPGRYPLAMLATGEHGFYERLGWERWRGASYVVRRGVRVRTSEDDDALMALRLPGSHGLDLSSPVACEDRPGDAW
ncbi:GNAT family N-acetyltransferase [Nocardioides sp. dk4132]|uniref:GNAT family N-acetyltransferase n=1 Tax=unclassified Nocardioides TaxID=2615069 RepID=UPI0012957365|nr:MULTISPECIES: GNAT family N-acetyltransferase [unclassified Nocardioides]MQW75772.1 GNAT family N-acetyltransferase [Nocardioides sp. dk4132]QGA08653.1 GNAT family N-acetyltransferase [Nocardioides sp. dk884]